MRIAWHVCLARGNYGRMKDPENLWPEKLWTAMADHAAKVVNPGTRVELRFLNVPIDTFMHPYLLLVNNALLVEDVLKCQEEGFDAVMLAAAIDPALDESRAAASITVAGSLESAMVISQFIGRRVGIIGVRAGYIPIIEQNIKRWGLQQRMIDNRPVRLCEMNYQPVMQALKGEGDEFITQYERVSRVLIEEGADVLIWACQYFGAIFNQLGYTGITDRGVPVIDCSAAGLKMVESMASLAHSIGLKKSESPFSPFRSLGSSLIKEATAIRRT